MTIDGTQKQLKKWRTVWLKAIALSWSNTTFKAELIADPRGALARHFGYSLPNYIELTIFDPTTNPTSIPKPMPEPGKNDKFGYHPREGGSPWIMPANQINLPLPPAPKEEDRAIALANFSDSNHYPFSTC